MVVLTIHGYVPLQTRLVYGVSYGVVTTESISSILGGRVWEVKGSTLTL